MKNRPNTQCLNTLKFIAACVVAFLWHYQHFAPADGYPFSRVFIWSYRYGFLMVELFFMLSGFGMYMGYFSRIQAREIRFGEYLVKRLRKIYPLFFRTLFLVCVLEVCHIWLAGELFVYPNFDLWHLFLNLILCQDGIFGTEWSFNSPSWCISICFINYMFFYGIVYFFRSRKGVAATYAGLGILGIIVLMAGLDFPFLINYQMARGLAGFSMGVLLATAYEMAGQSNIMVNSKSNAHFDTKIIGYGSFAILLVLYVLYIFTREPSDYMQLTFILVTGPAIIMSILYVPWLNRLLSWSGFKDFGALSLGIYLFHFPVQCMIRNLDLWYSWNMDYSNEVMWLVYVASTICIAVTYRAWSGKKKSDKK